MRHFYFKNSEISWEEDTAPSTDPPFVSPQFAPSGPYLWNLDPPLRLSDEVLCHCVVQRGAEGVHAAIVVTDGKTNRPTVRYNRVL